MRKHFPVKDTTFLSERVATPKGVMTLCGLRRPRLTLFQTPQEAAIEPANTEGYVGCVQCMVRLYRLGEARNLSTDTFRFDTWTWEVLGYPGRLDDETLAALGETRLTHTEENSAVLALVTTSRDSLGAFRDLYPERYRAIFGDYTPSESANEN